MSEGHFVLKAAAPLLLRQAVLSPCPSCTGSDHRACWCLWEQEWRSQPHCGAWASSLSAHRKPTAGDIMTLGTLGRLCTEARCLQPRPAPRMLLCGCDLSFPAAAQAPVPPPMVCAAARGRFCFVDKAAVLVCATRQPSQAVELARPGPASNLAMPCKTRANTCVLCELVYRSSAVN